MTCGVSETYSNNGNSSQSSDEADHRGEEASNSRASSLLQTNSRSRTVFISSALASCNVGDHPRDSLRLIPSGSSDHPVAEERPEEDDKGQAEGDEEKRVVETAKIRIEQCQKGNRSVQEGCEECRPEVQAGRVGELV